MAIPIYDNISKLKNMIEFPICGDDIINAKINLYHSAQRTFKITTILSIIFINLQLLFNIVIIVLKYRIDRKSNNKVEPFINKNPDFAHCADFNYNPNCPI